MTAISIGSTSLWGRAQALLAKHTLSPQRALSAGLRSLSKLPAVASMQARAAAAELGGQWKAAVTGTFRAGAARPGPSVPPALQIPKDGVIAVRSMTPRDLQVQADRKFFASHRQELANGANWAGRAQDGALRLMRHSSVTAEMFRAVDRSTRVEGGNDSIEYLKGEGVGAVDGITQTVNGALTLGVFGKDLATRPAATVIALNQAGASRSLVAFSQNSTGVVAQAAQRCLNQIADAHREPFTAGRFGGRLGTEVCLGAVPPWATVGVWAIVGKVGKGAARVGEVIRDGRMAARTLEELPLEGFPCVRYPNRAWRPWHKDHSVPTGRVGGRPTGTGEIIKKSFDETTVRSFRRQAESADELAAAGYRVKHRPQGAVKKPDLEIEGKVFDVYAPERGRVRNIHSEVEKKVTREQTRRVVLNLNDCPVTIVAACEQFKSWPISGLEEVIAIRNGTIAHIYP